MRKLLSSRSGILNEEHQEVIDLVSVSFPKKQIGVHRGSRKRVVSRR